MLPLLVALYRFGRSIRLALKDPEFEALLTLLIIVLASGTLFYHDIEGWRWLDSFYFSVITLTTVGYGDLTPHTDLGKIFTMVYLFIGIGTLFGFINIMTRHTVEQSKERPLSIIPGLWPSRKAVEEETDKMAGVR